MSYKIGNPGTRSAVVDAKGVMEPVVLSAQTSLFGTVGTATEAAGAATVNSPKGRVTLAAVLNATTGFALTLTNSYITATSVILCNVKATTATAAAARVTFTCNVTSQTAGSCVLQVYNGDAANSSAAPVVMFLVV
jgi:hypothetical protein